MKNFGDVTVIANAGVALSITLSIFEAIGLLVSLKDLSWTSNSIVQPL